MSNLHDTDILERPSHNFLDEVYQKLGYKNGMLLDAVPHPNVDSAEEAQWLENGDWLALAHRIGAEKVLFTGNDPVFVFCDLSDKSEQDLINAYRRAWCMARPRSLFISLPGELRVYSLSSPPARNQDEWRQIQPLERLHNITEVATQLQAYRREAVESGHLFEEKYFGSAGQRADRRLLHDLKAVRKALLNAGLPLNFTHALIGRAIFIRYLEDRNILTPQYFERLTHGHPEWQELLVQEVEKPQVFASGDHRRFYRVLRNKAFTFALFEQLAQDFNGDMFPGDPENVERFAVQLKHLDLLRRFLLGESISGQESLFFWAYDFEIVPISLISSIYEEFYHQVGEPEGDAHGTHYTPSFLVEDALSRTLTAERLATSPRIIDPSCGSGVFLVEAFRRVIRYKTWQLRRSLSPSELRTILKTQIVGIEINEEATQVAALSLYLALLHYQEPPDILEHPRLPNLINKQPSAEQIEGFNILFGADAFSLTNEEALALRKRIATKQWFQGRSVAQKLLEEQPQLGIEIGSFDVVIGNPPWRKAPTNSRAMQWANVFHLRVGDNSYPQLFIHRALSLVREGGIVSLFLHSNILFNQREPNREFRKYWLSNAKLIEVINFVHIRRKVFENAVAPFVFVSFQSVEKIPSTWHFSYISARNTVNTKVLQSLTLTTNDRRLVRQSEVVERDYLWKTYWWGSHRDAALLSALDLEARLEDFADDAPRPGYGFQRGSSQPDGALRHLRVLGSRNVQYYGPLLQEWFEPSPQGVKRQPDERLYRGRRLIAVRGIRASGMCVRLEHEDFAFRHTFYGISLNNIESWIAKIIIGICWSTLGQYRTFMVSGGWGNWHDSTVPSDIMSMPIRIPKRDSSAAQRIITNLEC
jgi:hypothetical protein